MIDQPITEITKHRQIHFAQRHHALAVAPRQAHVVQAHQQRQALLAVELQQQLHHAACRLGVERGHRLVGQQHAGALHQRTRDGGTLVARDLGEVRSAAQRRALRATTGMVFQQHHLIGRSSVLHNVLMGRLGHRSGWASLGPWSRAEKALALAAIDRVGLLERALQRADQLSGGQQQRVGVARALVQQPRVLLADEPVASLDPATAERLLALMHDICRRERLCVVVSLHQVAFARAFADRIVGLRQGAVVFDSDAAALSEPMLGALYGSGAVDPAVPGTDPAASAARPEPPRRADPDTPPPSSPTPAVTATSP